MYGAGDKWPEHSQVAYFTHKIRRAKRYMEGDWLPMDARKSAPRHIREKIDFLVENENVTSGN